MAGGFTWLRSTIEHHSIAIVDVGRGGGLDHYSYDLGSWEDFKTWADRLTDLGVPVRWGPGRHGPGNNLFNYFIDPFGIVIEYTAEVEQVDESYRPGGPQDWKWPPGRVDQWGISPPPGPELKDAQRRVFFVPT